MEKFRTWGDAATGINPFVFPVDELSIATRIVHVWVLFPVRVVLAVILLLLLFILDTVAHLLRVVCLSVVPRYTLAPLATVVTRGVLWLLAGGLSTRFRILPPKPAAAVVKDDTLKAPKAGDLILCNLQSPLDVLAIRCALPTIYSSNGSEWAGAMERGAVFAFYDPVGGAAGAPLADFCPSPFQMFKAARFIRHLAKPEVIRRMDQPGLTSSLAEVPPIQIDVLQRRAVKLGVPVILFAEGTTTNGKGILPFPKLQISTRRGGDKDKGPLIHQQVFISGLHYPHAPATACVVDRSSTALSFLSNVCARTDSGCQATFTIARPSAAVDMAAYMGGDADATDYTTSAAWLADCRGKMCALVQYRNPGVTFKPLSVGLKEKIGFVNQFLGTMK